MYGTPRRPATEAEAKALASSLRLRILRVCLDEPHTNREIARRLELNPGTSLYHVRKLVATGFLAPQPPRRGPRGTREIPYLATGKSWRLETPGVGRDMVDAFLEEYRRIRDTERVRMSRLGLRLTDEEYAEVTGRVAALFEELAARPPSPGGAAYSLFFSLHPDVDREDPEPPPT